MTISDGGKLWPRLREVIKEQMGHSSIQVTGDIYGRFVPGSNRQAVDRLDDAPICNPHATGKAERLRCEP